MTDSERLDWLDKQKMEHHAIWTEDGWLNPFVEWRVSKGMRNGTYDFPFELSNMTVREAIDAAAQPDKTK